jgi:hypothetical protein
MNEGWHRSKPLWNVATDSCLTGFGGKRMATASTRHALEAMKTIGFHVRRVEESADLEKAQANIPEPTARRLPPTSALTAWFRSTER